MKPRFASAAQIEKAIDRCHANSRLALFKADEETSRAAILLRQSSDFFEQASSIEDKPRRDAMVEVASKLKVDAGKAKEESTALRKYATNLIEKKARRLKAKLAEFQTALLPGMPGDGSVQK